MLGKQKCCNGGLEARRGHLTSAPWLSLPGLNCCCCCGEMLSITRCTHPMTKRWIFLRKCKRVTIDKMGIKVNTFRLYNAQHKYEIGQNTTVKNMLNLVKCSIVKTGKHCKLSNLIKSCPLKLEAAYFVARLPHKPIKLATSSVAVILVWHKSGILFSALFSHLVWDLILSPHETGRLTEGDRCAVREF